MANELAVRKQNSLFVEKMFSKIESTENALAVGKFILDSGLAPKSYQNNPAGVMLAIEAGASLGLTWFHAMQNIVVINNVIMIMGDAAKAMVLDSGMCEEWIEEEIGSWANKDFVYTIKSKRKDRTNWEKETSFGYEDAAMANLIGKSGPWQTYPKGQCRYRALGFHARYSYPEVMKGFKTKEEFMDYPETVDAEYQEVKPHIAQAPTEKVSVNEAITGLASKKNVKKTVVKEPEEEIAAPDAEEVKEEAPVEEFNDSTFEAMIEHGQEEEDDDGIDISYELPVARIEPEEEDEQRPIKKRELVSPIKEAKKNPNIPKIEKPNTGDEEEDVDMLYNMVRSAVITAQGGVTFDSFAEKGGKKGRPFPMATSVLNAIYQIATESFQLDADKVQVFIQKISASDAVNDLVATNTAKDFWGKTIREAYNRNESLMNMFLWEPENGISKAAVAFFNSLS